MAKTITLNVVNGKVTITNGDPTIYLNQNGIPSEAVRFKNDAGQNLSVSFENKSPFIESSFSVTHNHSDTPTFKQGVSVDCYHYTVTDAGGSQAGGDIDITTSPTP